MFGTTVRQAIVLLLALAGASGAQPAMDSGAVRLILRARIPVSGAAPRLTLEGQTFQASPDLACFYQRRDFAPAWSDGEALRPRVEELLAAFAAVPDDGLRAEDYRLAALRRLAAAVRSRPDASGLAELDILLSNAFLGLARDLRNGRVNPATLYRDCALGRDATDLATVLEEALRADRVRATLAGLVPPDRGYELLREALGRYRRLALESRAEPVPPGPALRQGDRGERVAALRSRLIQAAVGDNDLDSGLSTDGAGLFDASLAEALRRFQARHGLEEDGVAGRAVLAELNQEAADHIRQIEVNLERWRWLPHDLGQRHVLVNIAAFRLEAVENGRSTLQMRVIVGKPYTRTPMFSSAMNAVILNPYWNVPAKIAVNELFPKARKDPSYFQREGFEVLPGSRLRQRPGPKTPSAGSSSSSPTASTSTCTTPRRRRSSAAPCAPSATAAFASRSRSSWRCGYCGTTPAGPRTRSAPVSTPGGNAPCRSPSRFPSTSPTGPPGWVTTASSGSVGTSISGTRNSPGCWRGRGGRKPRRDQGSAC